MTYLQLLNHTKLNIEFFSAVELVIKMQQLCIISDTADWHNLFERLLENAFNEKYIVHIP